MGKTTIRQGNIELLRILCMFFIMMFHFNLNVILRNAETSQTMNYMALFVNSLVVVAVNTFILISGFFSIKLKMRSVLSLLIQTLFYALVAVIIYLIFSLLTGSLPTYKVLFATIIKAFIPFHPYGLWFIPCYALLLFISPILNWLCEDKKAHLMTMAAIGGVICYILIGYEGYKIWNFILIYLIGRWIALYFNKGSSKQTKNAVVVLALSVLLTFCLSIWWINNGHDVADKTVFAYSSPWVLISSVALFIIFKNINISKRWIYYVAPSVLSLYLFHENSLTNQIIYIKPLRYIISLIQSDILAYLSQIGR